MSQYDGTGLLRFLISTFILVILLVVLWGIEYIDQNWLPNYFLDIWGVIPRNLIGLRGIIFAPFLHGSYSHLAGNTFGIIVFGGLVMGRSLREFWTVTIMSALISGLGIWLVGRPPVHVGYSGIIYGYFSYLIALAWFDRNFLSIFRSLLLLYLFWGIIWGIFPTDTRISWEGHLFGFLGGYWVASEYWG